MITTILVLIYLSFISLGLPDSILGASWPAIYSDINVPFTYAGILSMITTSGTIISSLLADTMIRKFGTIRITTFSVLTTAIAILAFGLTSHFWILCLICVPLGLGGGAIDSALNNFVALHFESKHMSWLHCFWGLGATIGPVAMSFFITSQFGWRGGYLTIAILQTILSIVLFLSTSTWKKFEKLNSALNSQDISSLNVEQKETPKTTIFNVFRIKYAKSTLISFFCYCGLESTVFLWASTYLVNVKNISTETAASWTAIFFVGMTIGRFFNGFLSMRYSNATLIRTGVIITFSGSLCMLIPFATSFQLVGLILIGLGLAPIYPCTIHETPRRFGASQSQAMIGIQMACAYCGSTFVPPLFGFISGQIGLWFFIPMQLILCLILFITTEISRTK